MTNTIRSWGLDATDRGPSTRLWGKQQPKTGQAWQDPRYGWGFFDDFVNPHELTTNWTLDNATAGASVVTDTKGGSIDLDSASSTADQGVQIQRLADVGYENFVASAASMIYFEARVTPTDIGSLTAGDGVQLFIGLGERDATFFAAGVISAANYLGFTYDAADTGGVLQFQGEKAGTLDDNGDATGASLVSGTSLKLGFVIHGVTKAVCFVNGKEIASVELPTAAIPVVNMVPTLCCLSEGTVDPILSVDWVGCLQVESFSQN